jgi:hypothetical protein
MSAWSEINDAAELLSRVGPDLVAFIRTRLDEDEEIARRTGDGVYWVPPDLPPGAIYEQGGTLFAVGLGNRAAHIARHDPVRVFREVAAKRKLLTHLLAEIADCTCEAYSHHETIGLHLLAACWSNHPDFRQEWAP